MKDKIAIAKAFSIYKMLLEFSHEPVLEKGNELGYYAPWRDENNPSMWVNIKGNVFKDFGSDRRGDAISLYMALTNKPFLMAVKELSENVLFSEDMSKLEVFVRPQTAKPKIVNVQDLTDARLLDYALSRGISLATIRKYCKQVSYIQSNGKTYSSIGFLNNAGGYELRSAGFKSCLGKKDISLITAEESNYCLIFEGFFDFLSFFELKPHFNSTNYDFIILNSNSLVYRIAISKYEKIYSYLDKDPSGRKTLELINKKREKSTLHFDCSHSYTTDLNDDLIAQQSKTTI